MVHGHLSPLVWGRNRSDILEVLCWKLTKSPNFSLYLSGYNETPWSGHFFRRSPLDTFKAILFFTLYRYGVYLFRLQLTLKCSRLVSEYLEHACFVAVTSALCDTLYSLSELVHHDQNIPGIHSPSESKIVPGSQGALSPCILLYGTWFLLQWPPVLTKLASSCSKKNTLPQYGFGMFDYLVTGCKHIMT